MILIELKKIIKDGVIIVLVLFLLFMAMILTEKESYIAPALEVFLLLFACFSGWSIFERERQEGAMEYLLSMPVSRTRVFLIKLSVRLLSLLVVLFFYYLLHQRYQIHFFFSELSFILLFFTIFLLSLSLSLSIKSFLSSFFITLFLSIGLYQFIKIMDFSKTDSQMAIQTFISFLIIPLLFLLFFHKYDIKPISFFNKKYIPSVVFSIFLIFGITYLTTHVRWWHCFLSDDGDVFRVSRKKTVIIDQEGNKEILKQPIEPLFQKGKNLYASSWAGKNKIRKLVRFDLKSGKIHNVASIESGFWFHNFIDTRTTLGDRIYFLLTSGDHRRYKILEIRENESRVILVKGDFGDEKFHMICGAINDPLQFIVMTLSPSNHSTGSRVFRIWEDGSTDFLFAAESIAFWKGKLLRFTGEGIILYLAGQKFKEIINQPGNYKKCRRKFENYIQKKVVLKKGNQYFVFDMKDQTLERMDIQKSPYFYDTTREDDLRMVWTNGPEIESAIWKDHHIQVEKTWYTGIEGLKIIRVFRSGILVYYRNEYEVFLLEDEEEGVTYRK
jgi:hypothetical protein